MLRLLGCSWVTAHPGEGACTGFVWAQGGRAGMPGLHFG